MQGDNLEVKEIVVGNGEARQRYVLVRNPRQAEPPPSEAPSASAKTREVLEKRCWEAGK